MSTLAYCTNVHPSETFEEVLRVITGPAREVREGLEQARLPIGLYLSNRASEEIARDRACLETLQAALHASKFDVVTFNGFPYGGFQDKVVKTRVYQPDWSSKQRLEYTKRLAGIFVNLVPESADVSISTLAGGFAADFKAEEVEVWLRHLAYFANYSHQLESETGRCVRLAIEAEPFTALERASQVMDFFRERVWRASRDFLVKHFGFNPNRAEEALRRHIAVCYDCCHQALFTEDAADFFAAAQSEELAIAKIQLSSALEIRDRDGLHEIERFVEERFLHQVVASTPHGQVAFLDLPEAIKELRKSDWSQARSHFHVPIFWDADAPLGSTQKHLVETIHAARRYGFDQCLEIETYTWSVLPKEFLRDGIEAGIVEEFRWASNQLAVELPSDSR